MNALAIDTSTESLGLALETNGRSYLRVCREGLKHAQTLAPQINQILAQGGLKPEHLDLIVVAAGPGSFTGLRIGIATAKGLARGTGADIVGICTLDAYGFRQQAFPGLVIPVIDARKGRLYAGLYRAGVRQGELLDASPDRILDAFNSAPRILLTGPHAASFKTDHASSLQTVSVDQGYRYCSPDAALALGVREYRQNGRTLNLTPIYLRLSEAEEKRISSESN